MTSVRVGSNLFVDCETLVTIRDSELLRVARDPLRVSLTTPPNLSSGRTVRVTNNIAAPSKDVNVVATDKSVAILWGHQPLVIATLIEADTVSLKIDLRPIGVNLYDDGTALHAGGNAFAGNLLKGNEVGIRLG